MRANAHSTSSSLALIHRAMVFEAVGSAARGRSRRIVKGDVANVSAWKIAARARLSRICSGSTAPSHVLSARPRTPACSSYSGIGYIPMGCPAAR